MWKQLLTKASDLLPDFNNYLLLDFRKDKINQIKYYLDTLFKESVKKFGGRLTYLGFKVLTPDERLKYIRSNKIINRKVQILDSSFELVRYAYDFRGEQQYIHVFVPYLVDNKILMNGTHYYILFPEIEAGSLHRTHNEIILKVMAAPITMYRDATFEFTTNKGKKFKESVCQVRIHQGRRGRSKSAGKVPILLYHLVHLPFQQCMMKFKFGPEEISIVPTCSEEADYSYIKIKDNIFLRVHDQALNDMHKRRVIASYLMCLNEWNHFLLRDLLADDLTYYYSVLGRYTYSQIQGTDIAKTFMYAENAVKHLKTTDSILDPPARYQLSQIGINVSDIYEFLYAAFYQMDEWLVGYDPTNMFDKKIATVDQLLAPLVSAINKKLFSIVNAKEEELKTNTVKSWLAKASQMENWISSNSVFRANPSFCNDSWLITIGTKRFRSLEAVETSVGNGKSKSKNMTASLLKAHYSHLIVESICSIPSSSPVISGEINPYLQISEDGMIKKPEWADDIAHVFD